MKYYLIGLFTGLILGFSVGISWGSDTGRIYHKYKKMVVEVHGPHGSGTGVVINRAGDVLTNAHVVDYSTASVVVIPYPGEAFYTGKVIKFDKAKDLALIDTAGKSLDWKYIKLGKDDLYVGETVYSIGHPYGNTWTISKGIISGPQRYWRGSSRAQSSVMANSGSSGSPLLDKKGRLVGLVMGNFKKLFGGWAGITICVTIKDIQQFMKRKPRLGGLKWSKQFKTKNLTSEKMGSSILFDVLTAEIVPGEKRTIPSQ